MAHAEPLEVQQRVKEAWSSVRTQGKAGGRGAGSSLGLSTRMCTGVPCGLVPNSVGPGRSLTCSHAGLLPTRQQKHHQRRAPNVQAPNPLLNTPEVALDRAPGTGRAGLGACIRVRAGV